ncbi:MAG: SDR family oxidoreductase, partial [Ilumatobacteraceae bacterium]
MAGRRVLVIGAGQETYDLPPEEVTMGNGRAASVRMAQEGAMVACADLHLDRAQDTVTQIVADGGRAQAFAVDATDEASMTELFAAATTALGGLDGVLVNVG